MGRRAVARGGEAHQEDVHLLLNFKRLGRGIIPECEYMARRFPLLAEEIRSFVNDPPEEQLKKIQELTGKKTDYWMKLEAPGIYAKILANRAMKKGEKPVTDLAEDPGIMAPLVEEKLATEEGRSFLTLCPSPALPAESERCTSS